MCYVITAKYPGTCECGWEWELGETIYLVESGKPPVCCGCYQTKQVERIEGLKRRPRSVWPQENE